ncbi:MAG: SgcJ/EcaC family oxidoreductase [Rubrobacter sp.]|nr:SgcJ/EcaC family oxidoreductase [Rubrobacter sp.]
MNHEPTTHHTDEAEIRTLFEELLADWGRGDGRAYGSRFTEDADYIAFDGTRTRGSGEIYRSHQELFDKWLKGTRLVGGDPDIKFLTPEVALVHATGGTIMRGKSRPSPERHSIQTLVAVKHDGKWRFAAFHNSRVRPIGSFRGFLLWAFTDLLWKVPGRNKEASHG